MRAAACMILRRPPYRGDRFIAGLRRAGFEVITTPQKTPRPGDVLVIWNRSGGNNALANRYEKAGGRVLVVENGYFGRDWRGGHWYAIAEGQHSGAGTWREGGKERWESWGVELRPWREGGKEIVILASRGFGSNVTREPKEWPYSIISECRSRGVEYPVRIRPHPGPPPHSPKKFERDTSDAWACVTWASTAGLRALELGIPVFHGLEGWIGAQAAYTTRYLDGRPDARFIGDRLPMFRRLAWAQWEIFEIERGDPFAWLLT